MVPPVEPHPPALLGLPELQAFPAARVAGTTAAGARVWFLRVAAARRLPVAKVSAGAIRVAETAEALEEWSARQVAAIPLPELSRTKQEPTSG